MATKTKQQKLLSKAERSITALQRGALTKLQNQPERLGELPWMTITSLLNRKLIDRVGKREAGATYVLTDKGRSVLAYRESHTGRAQR